MRELSDCLSFNIHILFLYLYEWPNKLKLILFKKIIHSLGALGRWGQSQIPIELLEQLTWFFVVGTVRLIDFSVWASQLKQDTIKFRSNDEFYLNSIVWMLLIWPLLVTHIIEPSYTPNIIQCHFHQSPNLIWELLTAGKWTWSYRRRLLLSNVTTTVQ